MKQKIKEVGSFIHSKISNECMITATLHVAEKENDYHVPKNELISLWKRKDFKDEQGEKITIPFSIETALFLIELGSSMIRSEKINRDYENVEKSNSEIQ